jgi:hypothetical protein
MACDRVYVAGGRSLCLRAGRGVITPYTGSISDAATFREQHSFSLPGNPIRARVSADGRLVAYTVFGTGDGDNQIGFSKRTFIRDAATGRQLAQLEQFTTRRDGRVIHAGNFNAWGVTSARDDNAFYATLGSGDKTYPTWTTRSSGSTTTSSTGCPRASPRRVMDVWRLFATGGGKPRRLVTGPWSPAVIRN